MKKQLESGINAQIQQQAEEKMALQSIEGKGDHPHNIRGKIQICCKCVVHTQRILISTYPFPPSLLFFPFSSQF